MHLGRELVRELLPMKDLLPAMEGTLADFSSGKVVQPLRTVIPVDEHGGYLFTMPAYSDALGVKLVTLFPNNRNLPTHHAIILLFSPQTGELLVSMDGELITELRTAAVSAIATQYLARGDSVVLALIGSGVQARGHLEALRLVRHFREVRVYSPNNAVQFAKKYRVHAVETAQAAVRDADVIVTATTSRKPVLSGAWLRKGAHINAVGAPRLDWRELDDSLLSQALIYVDSRDAAEKESGDVRAAGSIIAEIGEVISGQKAGREADDQITLFKSVGMAVEDIVAANLVFQRALELGRVEPS